MITLRSAVCAGVALVAMNQTAAAMEMAALQGNNALVVIDGDAMSAGTPRTITGVSGELLGIDVRPADGNVYGVASDNRIYRIDTANATATAVSTLSQPFPTEGRAVVDFNPTVDRLRLMSSDGTNYRVNVDTGEVTVDGKHGYAAGDMRAGMAPMITAGAYTNSFVGAKETKLYTIDGTAGTLAAQIPPNDGVQNSVGKLGVPLGETEAFDIHSTMGGATMATLVSGEALYAVDPATGAASEKGAIRGLAAPVLDIAFLP